MLQLAIEKDLWLNLYDQLGEFSRKAFFAKSFLHFLQSQFLFETYLFA